MLLDEIIASKFVTASVFKDTTGNLRLLQLMTFKLRTVAV